MLGLSQLGTVLADPELRALLKSVITRKINSDLKTVQAHAELSKRLAQSRRANPNGEGDELRQIVKEHLEYYSTLVDLSLNFHQRLLDDLAAQASAQANGAGGQVNGLTLAMTAPMGATVRAPFKISNNRAEAIAVTCRASPFVSEDGNQLIASRIAFNPPGAEIAPGAEEVFEAILPVTPDFAAGRLYLATLSADGFDAMSIVVRLRVEAPVEQPEPAAEGPAPEAPEQQAENAPETAAPRRKRAVAKRAVSASSSSTPKPARKRAPRAAGAKAAKP